MEVCILVHQLGGVLVHQSVVTSSRYDYWSHCGVLTFHIQNILAFKAEQEKKKYEKLTQLLTKKREKREALLKQSSSVIPDLTLGANSAEQNDTPNKLEVKYPTRKDIAIPEAESEDEEH